MTAHPNILPPIQWHIQDRSYSEFQRYHTIAEDFQTKLARAEAYGDSLHAGTPTKEAMRALDNMKAELKALKVIMDQSSSEMRWFREATNQLYIIKSEIAIYNALEAWLLHGGSENTFRLAVYQTIRRYISTPGWLEETKGTFPWFIHLLDDYYAGIIEEDESNLGTWAQREDSIEGGVIGDLLPHETQETEREGPEQEWWGIDI